MNSYDCVLVGVIKTWQDFRLVRDKQWYRIPQAQMPRGVKDDYLAFFLSGRDFKKQSGSIPYFARNRGYELHKRKDLIPAEPNHDRAENIYYKVQLGELQTKKLPIVNASKRRFAFIRTTWDRFNEARTIADLYSTDDYFVDRIYHALQSPRLPVERYWDAERPQTDHGAQLRIMCQTGEVIASPQQGEGTVYMNPDDEEDAILAKIRKAIADNDGPVMNSLSLD